MALNPDDTLLNGHYHIVRLLGRGGFGFVYEAQDTLLNEKVAIKELIPALVGDETMLKRFLAEARATMRLRHERIVGTHNVFSEEDNFYIVMEYMAGGSLEARLREQGRLAVEEALQVAGEVCEGLAYAHGRGVVHCDLKPANILFDEDGRANVADFGIAHVSGEMLTRSWMTPVEDDVADRVGQALAVGMPGPQAPGVHPQRVDVETGKLASFGILDPNLGQGLQKALVTDWPHDCRGLLGWSRIVSHDGADDDASSYLVDTDPLHLAELLQVPIERAAWAAGELGHLLGREGRRAFIVVGPAQPQDAGHGHDQGIVDLGVGDGHRRVDVGGRQRFFHGSAGSNSSSSWTSVGWA